MPISFLHGFVEHLATYRIHVQGHPPGFLLVLWTLERLGLGSQSAVAALEIGVCVLAIPAVLLAVRDVAGDAAARAAAPFVAVAPVAIWVATSADAFYAGVSAWAVALVVLASGRQDGRSVGYALGGGVLFGVTAFLSYGLILLAIIPIAVAWQRRRIGPLVFAAIGASSVFATFALNGFWWFDGLAATRRQYFAGVASATALPRVPPGRRRLLRDRARARDRRRRWHVCGIAALWLVVGAALLAVAGRSVQRYVEGRGRTDLAAVRRMGAAGGHGARARRPSSPVVGGPSGVHHRPTDVGAEPMVMLVTGGAGFIGSFVVDRALAARHEVRVLDRLHPGAHQCVPDYLDARADYLWGDVADPEVGARAVDGVDAVCHQAAMVGLGVDFADARAYVRDNGMGTATLLGVLPRSGLPRPARRCQQHGRVRRWRVPAATGTVSVRPRPRTRAALDADQWDPMCPDCGGGCTRSRWPRTHGSTRERLCRDQAAPGAPVCRVRS